MECSLAKPQADPKSSGGPNAQKSALHTTYPPRLGYGLVGGPYNPLGGGYVPAGLPQVTSNHSLNRNPTILFSLLFLFINILLIHLFCYLPKGSWGEFDFCSIKTIK